MPEVHADGLYGVVPERGLFQARGGPVFFGVVPKKGGFQARGSGFLWAVPERGGFQARYRLHSALPSPSVQSEDGHLQRCGGIQFNFVAPQSEIGVIWQKSTEVRKE